LSELEDDDSAYSYKNAPGFSLIMLMRIYDVQMAILNEMSPDAATAIDEVHSAGRIVADPPSYAGDA
jgi:hypothetical protein